MLPKITPLSCLILPLPSCFSPESFYSSSYVIIIGYMLPPVSCPYTVDHVHPLLI